MRTTSAIGAADEFAHPDEQLQFSQGHHQSAQVLDTTAPAAPTMSLTKNAQGYVVGSTAFVVGLAEANSAVKVYASSSLVGSALADASGFWSVSTSPFSDGSNYQIFARAVDAAGNTSGASASVSFHVDAHAPLAPGARVATIPGGNQPAFSGSGEAGATIYLVNGMTLVGQTKVGATGNWAIDSHPLPNASYNITVIAADQADNSTKAAATLGFTVSSTDNLTGSAGNDMILAPALGNNAIEGLGGIDTALYSSSIANFMVAKAVNGFTVTDRVGSNGQDALVNFERIEFSDGHLALDVDGVAGQAFRLYQAAFDRTPDLLGLGYWIKSMDSGLTLKGVAEEFMISPEFIELYGENAADAGFFVNKLYLNVLDRAPEKPGFDFWMNVLQQGHNTRAEVLAFFSESPENQAQVIGSIENGFAYTPWI